MAGERILICDDGRENRDFIIDYIIEPNNFEVLTAKNGVEAMEIMRSQPLDLILLDLQMPKMGGLEVLDTMNAEEIRVPVVLMTFHGSEEIAIEVYRKGVRDYVKKPFSVEEMTAAIGRALSEVRLRQEKEKLTERVIAANAEMTQRIRELNMLYKIGKSVTALTSMNELLPRVLRAAIEITDSEAGSLFLVHGERLVGRAVKYPGEPQIQTINQPLENPFAWRAVHTSKPLVLNRAEMQELRRDHAAADLPEAVLVTPMIVGKRTIGAVMLNNVSPEAGEFRKQDGAMLSALSDYAAIAIENARNLARAEQAGHTDETSHAPREVLRLQALLLFIGFDDTNAPTMSAAQHWDMLSLRASSLSERLAEMGAQVWNFGGKHLVGAFDPEQYTPLQILNDALTLYEENETLHLTLNVGEVLLLRQDDSVRDISGMAFDDGLKFHLLTTNERVIISTEALRFFNVDEIDVEPLQNLPCVRFLNII